MAKATRMDADTMGKLGRSLPMGTDPHSVRRRVEAMEHLLERSLSIPGINYKIGLDVVLDLLPIGGTTVAAILGGYMIWEARNIGMSKGQMLGMAGNVVFDWALGLIPWVGAVPDLLFRSNSRNLRMIKRHLDKHHPSSAVIEQKG